MSAGLELLRHHRVHGDHHLLLPGHLQVPILHLVDDPVLEGLANHGCTNIDDPLLRCLRDVGFVGQVMRDSRLLTGELEDLLQGQVLVLRHVHGLDFVVRDVRLLLGQDVLQKVNGDVVCSKETVSGILGGFVVRSQEIGNQFEDL